MGFKSFFVSLGGLLKRAFGLAQAAGLTDELVQLALGWVREAEKQTIDNPAKRELVLAALKAKGVPEGLARLVLELAVRLLKAELAKAGV